MYHERRALEAWCNGYECVAAHSIEEACRVVREMGTYEEEDVDGEGWVVLANDKVLHEEDGTPTSETIGDLLRESDVARPLYSCIV